MNYLKKFDIWMLLVRVSASRNIHEHIRQQMRDMERMAQGMFSPFGSLFGMQNSNFLNMHTSYFSVIFRHLIFYCDLIAFWFEASC